MEDHINSQPLLSNRTLYLRADSQEAFETAMIDAGWSFENEQGEIEPRYFTVDYSVDVIGVIKVPTGNTITVEKDGESIEIDEFAAVDGWHANLRVTGNELPESISALLMETAPTNPVRSFG
jgi:hypothetical protein